MNIKYKITFYSDWHCGSGLAAGADVDALVVKDKDGLPFIPGKTMKGLIKEAAEEVVVATDKSFVDAFGLVDEKGNQELVKGQMFFTNAELDLKEREEIIAHGLSAYMYRDIASTMINEKGISEEHSLRKSEVVIPCELYGKILDVPEGLVGTLEKALCFIKRLGVNRNRGWGRCDIKRIYDRKEEKGGIS